MESGTPIFKQKPAKQEKNSKCLIYILASIVILSFILLIFATIVLRFRTPRLHLESVTVTKLEYSRNASTPFMNVTLVNEIAIKNANFGPFKLENGGGSFSYGADLIGDDADVKVQKGRVVGARRTERVNVTVGIKIYSLSRFKNLSSEIKAGLIEVRSHVKLSGRVYLFDVLKKMKHPEMNCRMTLNLRSQMVRDLICNSNN